jgi:hypothetical protein
LNTLSGFWQLGSEYKLMIAASAVHDAAMMYPTWPATEMSVQESLLTTTGLIGNELRSVTRLLHCVSL